MSELLGIQDWEMEKDGGADVYDVLAMRDCRQISPSRPIWLLARSRASQNTLSCTRLICSRYVTFALGKENGDGS